MMMADGTSSFGWQLDDGDDEKMSMDVESLFRILNESPQDDSLQNGLADESLFNESASYAGFNGHSQIRNGSLTFSPSDHSEASASRTVCSSGSSDCEKPAVNVGFTKVEPRQDAVSSMHFSSGGPDDWALPVPGHGTPNNGVCQDFSSFNQPNTRETNFESDNRSGTFWFSDSNGNHQLMDKSGISDGMYYNSVTDSCRTLEASHNAGSQYTSSSRYSDIGNEPSDEFSMPYIMNTIKPYFGPSRLCHNSDLHPRINDDGMSLNVKAESEENLMHNASSNSAANYRSYASAEGACLPSSESSPNTPAKGSTGGRHLPCMFNIPNQMQVGCVKDAKSDMQVATMGTAHQSFEVMDDVDSKEFYGVADQGLSQSFSGVFNSFSSRDHVVKGEQESRSHQFINIIDSTYRSKRSFTDNHGLDVQSPERSFLQYDVSSKNQMILTEEERVSKFSASISMGSLPSKISRQAVPNSTSGHITYIDDDDDDDICVLEDMSVPARKKQSPVEGQSLVTAQRSSLGSPPVHIGSNNARFKANDERFIYRVALQDLYQPKSEESPPDGSLAVPLLRHQRIALSWMVHKETKSMHCFGGILADDQGLGKTISTIALILKERSPSSGVHTAEIKEKETETLNLDDDDDVTEPDKSKQEAESWAIATNGSSVECRNTSVKTKSRPAAGTLVVCPTSVLRQWNDELHNKVSSKANLSVLVYHGGNRTKDPFELAKYDVVLTTYAIVGMEVPKQPLVDEDDDETKRRSDIVSMGLSSSKKRKYLNGSCKSSKKDKMGMDSELFESLARPLAKVRWFRVVLDEAQSIKNHRTQVARACWGLRAKRRWCLSGTPIQNAIDDLYSYFRFLRYDPYAVYKSFCSTIKAPIQRSPGSGYKKLQAILKTIMLRRTKGTLLDGEPIISLPPKTVNLKKVDFTAEERDFYCRLEADSRAQFAEYAAAGTVKQNYVNILLMLLRLRQACDHPLLVRGCSSNSEWRSSLDKARKLPQEKRSRLLECLEASLAICSICNDPPEDAVVTTCEHVFCNQCILEHLSSDDSQCPFSKCKVILNTSSVFSKSTLKLSIDYHQPGQNNAHDCNSSLKAEVLEPCLANGSVNASSIEAAEALDSSKIKAALEVLHSIGQPRQISVNADSISSIAGSPEKSLKDPSDLHDKGANVNGNLVLREKAIVFSQWTRMLDLLEACLKNSSIGYRRLDGTMSVVARDKAVKDFNNVPEVTVMIMSLKAASLGLNMVAACHVLLLDLWWNPTTEDQAIDRAHRIGQTRPVSVLRLTVRDTVEDRILALQQKKREMVSSAFGEDETGSSQTRLTVDDLKYLFQA